MAAWRYEIYLLVLKNISRVSAANYELLEEKFRISARPCNILYFFPVKSLELKPLVSDRGPLSTLVTLIFLLFLTSA